MLPGQLAADSHEAGQRRPGDFEAQVSQRPIAVHGLEHLGATDRGVTMFRNQIRRGIRAVSAGEDPAGIFRDGGAAIPTYCNDTVVRVPPARTPERDRKLLRATGRKLAEGYIAQPPLYKIKRGKREEYVETEDDMANMLLELGAEGQELVQVKTKKTFKEKTLLELLRLLVELESLSRGISRHRIDLAKYFQFYTGRKGLPLYYIRTDGEEHFLYDDEELAKFAKKNDLDLEELEKASVSAKAQYVELFEASEIAGLSKKLEKFGVSLEEYYPQDSKPAFKLVGEKTQAFAGLRDVLLAIQEEGRRGMTIQRYKGLGEMNPTQLWETTMDPAKRTILKVTQEDAVEAEQMFTTLMGEEVEPRKQFLEEHALEVKNLDV